MPITKTIRFADDLVADIEAEMKGSDRSFSYVVQRRCRADAWRGGNPIQSMPEDRDPVPFAGYPLQTDAEVKHRQRATQTSRDLAMERQRKLNEAKS